MSLENLKSRSDLSLDEIIQLMDQETDVRIYKKLLYFKFKAMNFTKIESYKLASIKKSTAYNLEDLWNEGGYNALLPKPGQGRKTKLNENQLKELETILNSKNTWLINDVINLINDKWKIEYSYVGLQNLLKSYFNVKIDNFYEIKQRNKNKLKNIVGNFSDIDEEDKNQINILKSCIGKEKDLNILKKLFYLLFKKLGFSTGVSSNFIGISTVTGNNWESRWKRRISRT